MIKRKHLLALSVLLACAVAGGCSALTGESQIDEGIVIAPKLKIRSSTAMVALDLAEVKRGDRLEILDQAEVKTPTRTEEWYKVRTKGKDSVTGWVEARAIINKAVAGKIDELYESSKTVPSQGTGRLKVQTRLRIEPGGDVATMLSRGTTVEIVGKARTIVKPERQQTAEDTDETTEEPEARTVLWYQVRLNDAEVLRAGWVGAQQVQLDVPDEILHLEGEGRRFTGWIVLDQTRDKEGKPKNNYVGLMKSLSTEGPVDFTRLWVLDYSPSSRRYYGAYIEDGL
ncbi:MAG TPA: GW dipeptide domain-containing protein, partial [Blastocatellia bacterium]|nr:GW dipeptide domain-containing protein [Blastocatellia bacterium]